MTDPTDPSTDLANVNAAYVVERDEAQRLVREVDELRAGISWARGLCSDEAPHARIDHFLGCVLAGRAVLPS